MYTYFLVATENEIAKMNSVEDLIKQVENTEPLLGGEFFTLEAITNLAKIFLEEKAVPIPTNFIWEDGSQFYILEKELCEKVADTEWNDILQASVPWSESKTWKNVEHNRMDLAGMIIDFSNLCKQTSEEKHLYFLLSTEN